MAGQYLGVTLAFQYFNTDMTPLRRVSYDLRLRYSIVHAAHIFPLVAYDVENKIVSISAVYYSITKIFRPI